MNIAESSIDKKVVTLVLTLVLLVGGLLAFQNMSRLEDPEFTIKDALVITPYPGATAAEVEEEVTDTIELAIQQLLYPGRNSLSYRGMTLPGFGDSGCNPVDVIRHSILFRGTVAERRRSTCSVRTSL